MSHVLHIGLHKTGSTYLQNAIWPQVKGRQYLTRPFTQYNHAFNKLQYADATLYDPRDVTKVLSAFAKDKFLISDEALSGKPLFFGSVNRSAIASRLRDLFPDATIVLFLRDQRDIILSHYNSYVKEPTGVKNLRDFIWMPGDDYKYKPGVREQEFFDQSLLYYNTNDAYLHVDSFKYLPLIELYTNLFERVELFLYEELRSQPKRIIERLSEIVEEDLSADARTWNRSYSRNELAIRRSLNRIRPVLDSDILVKGVSRLLGSVLPTGSKEAWMDDIHQIVGGYYSGDNLRLKTMRPELPWAEFPNKYL